MRIVLATALLVVVAGCGGEKTPTAEVSVASTPTSSATSPAPTPTETPVGLKILSKVALAGSLLDLNDMPPGFTQDAPDTSTTNKTFCDYKQPFEEKLKVSADFTNDADQQFLSSSLRQYATADQAKASFDVMVKTLKTCKTDRMDGTTLTYTPMSVPKLGDGSIGVQIEGDGYTIKQNFVVLGPTLISTGGVGVDAATVANLLQLQVDGYQAVAK